MPQQHNEALVTPYFRADAVEDPEASREAGRPIYKNVEMVELRIAGDRYYQPVFPAHSFWRRIDGEDKTYAERWPEQYARFKANQVQFAEGTPLEELTFLDAAARMTLKSAKVYTAEALASIEGVNIKTLGMDGRRWQAQAQAYLAKARGAANEVAMAAELVALRERLARLEANPVTPAVPPEPSLDDLKDIIQARTGQRPRGNPNRETLERLVKDTEGLEASAA